MEYLVDIFANVIEGWHDFYMMAGAAATTLVGLLFVSMSINLDLVAHEENADLRELAIQTFTNFLNIIIISLLFLIPNQDHIGLGLPLIGVSGSGLYITVIQFLKVLRSSFQIWGRNDLARHFVTPVICYLVMTIVGITVLFEQTGSLYWLVPTMITLIINASVNSWDLLLHLGKPTTENKMQKN
jgi:hypothetical protein